MSTRISLPGIARDLARLSVAASSVPSARTTSASARQALVASSHKVLPSDSGCDSGTRPLAAKLATTGAPSVSAIAATALPAPRAPPPTRINGRSAAVRSVAASAIRSAAGVGRGGGRRGFHSPAAGAASPSVGISMCTGRGLAL